MLTYITIGTNDLQRAAAFYDAIFKVLGYSRLPAWTKDWAMWGDENNPDEGFSFCICPPFDRQPATAGNGTMFAFRAATRSLSDVSMQQAFLREERVKACQGHEPRTAPIFMLPICAILTGISWHAFVSIILLKPIRSQTKNSHKRSFLNYV